MNALAFPPALAARAPGDTRLLVVRRDGSDLREHRADALPSLLSPGDLLVVNDAATLPASLHGTTERGLVELRLLGLPDARGECEAALFDGGSDWRTPTERRAPPPTLTTGERVTVGAAQATVRSASGRRVRLRFSVGDRDVLLAALYRTGRPIQYAYASGPLALWDVQNVFAAEPWAAEMPSAGRVLDFAALDALRRRGIEVTHVTHAAGLSSLGDARADASLPWPERTRVTPAAWAAVARARRVIAVGTSVVRALESPREESEVGRTSLRIDSQHRLEVVHGLLTGMHDETTSHADLLRAFLDATTLARVQAFARTRGFLGHELGDVCLILP